MAKGEKQGGGSLQDVEVYFNQIKQIIKQYRQLVDRLSTMNRKKKQFALQIPDLLMERSTLKEQFIAKKQAARANIALLKQGLDILKDKELRGLQEEFREIDNEFKGMGLMAEKESLFEGAEKRAAARDRFDPTRAKNDDLIDKAMDVQQRNLEKLKAGLQTVEATKEQGKHTAAQLENDREKLKRIDQGLDEVQGELELSKVYLTRMLKRLYTDKVIIAFATLLVMGIVGVIAYSVVNPGQKIFNVPDIVKPPCIDANGVDTACAQSLITTKTPSVTPSPRVRRLALRSASSSSDIDEPRLDSVAAASSFGAASGAASAASAPAAAASYGSGDLLPRPAAELPARTGSALRGQPGVRRVEVEDTAAMAANSVADAQGEGLPSLA